MARNDNEELMDTTENKQKKVDIVRTKITHINGNPFWGVLPDSVLRNIWTETFKRKPEELAVYNFDVVKKRFLKVNFELKKPIALDEIHPTPEFNFNYKTLGGSNLMFGTLVDYKLNVAEARIGDTVTVSVSRTNCEVRGKEICEWMNHFGETIGEHYYNKDTEGFSTGNFQIKLVLEHHIPEFLPIYGTKARIFYPGMPQQCARCYRVGHLQKQCDRKKIEWLDFVERLLDTGLYPKKLFGSWIEVLDDRDGKTPGKRAHIRDASPIKEPRRFNAERRRNDGRQRDRGPQFQDRRQGNERYHRRDRSPRDQPHANERRDFRGRDRSPLYMQDLRRDRRDRSPPNYNNNYDNRGRYARNDYEDRFARDRSPRTRDDAYAGEVRPSSYKKQERDARYSRNDMQTPAAREVYFTADKEFLSRTRLGNRAIDYEDVTPYSKKRDRSERSERSERSDGRGKTKVPRGDRGY